MWKLLPNKTVVCGVNGRKTMSGFRPQHLMSVDGFKHLYFMIVRVGCLVVDPPKWGLFVTRFDLSQNLQMIKWHSEKSSQDLSINSDSGDRKFYPRKGATDLSDIFSASRIWIDIIHVHVQCGNESLNVYKNKRYFPSTRGQLITLSVITCFGL